MPSRNAVPAAEAPAAKLPQAGEGLLDPKSRRGPLAGAGGVGRGPDMSHSAPVVCGRLYETAAAPQFGGRIGHPGRDIRGAGPERIRPIGCAEPSCRPFLVTSRRLTAA